MGRKRSQARIASTQCVPGLNSVPEQSLPYKDPIARTQDLLDMEIDAHDQRIKEEVERAKRLKAVGYSSYQLVEYRGVYATVIDVENDTVQIDYNGRQYKVKKSDLRNA